MTVKLPADLSVQLRPLALAAEFGEAEEPKPVGDIGPPAQSSLLRNSYAALLIVVISENSVTSLHSAVAESLNWMAEFLLDLQSKAAILDGYAAFALTAEPDSTLREEVRNVTLDPRICRKHVIWPTPSGDWTPSLMNITVLGLPTMAHAHSAPIPEAELPPIAKKALSLYADLGGYEYAAQQLEALAESWDDDAAR